MNTPRHKKKHKKQTAVPPEIPEMDASLKSPPEAILKGWTVTAEGRPIIQHLLLGCCGVVGWGCSMMFKLSSSPTLGA